jgi:hypothetical protein
VNLLEEPMLFRFRVFKQGRSWVVWASFEQIRRMAQDRRIDHFQLIEVRR